jgi:hypothetical protein
MRIAPFVVAAMAALSAWTAHGQGLPIEAFYGAFSGGAVAEDANSIYFATTARDTDVVIKPAPNGFSITWSSVIRQGGDPNNPRVRRKTTTRQFVRTDRKGLYRATNSGDPLAGGEMGWAHIRGRSLIAYFMVIDAKGAYQIQRYERTLSGLGMELTFTRIKDGEEVRTVKGRLVKNAN